jgi:hypothetical protein
MNEKIKYLIMEYLPKEGVTKTMEVLNTLLKESNGGAYKKGYIDGQLKGYALGSSMSNPNGSAELAGTLDAWTGNGTPTKPNDTAADATPTGTNNDLTNKPQNTTEHDKKIAEEAVRGFVEGVRLNRGPRPLYAWTDVKHLQEDIETYLSSRGDKGEI